MKTAAKTHKPRRQEKQANFISWRFASLCGCILLVLGFLLGRVVWLQITTPDMLMCQDDTRPLRVQEVSTSRGMITDHSGRPLVVSVPVKAVWADPKEVHDAGGVGVGERWRALLATLNLPLDQLVSHINANPKGCFTYLVRQVSPDMADYIKRLKLPDTHLREESRRYYPSGEMTAHPIGLTSVNSQGIEGVGKSFDKWLTGQPDERIVRKDRYGRVIEDISSVGSQAAYNLALSIDERLQILVYCELNNVVAFNKAEPGSTVLADINTGEVLVTANSPSYNPNNLIGMPKDAVCNRTTADVFEPGFTVKPMVMMTALQRGVVRENTVLNTIPHRINGHEIKDVARYSELTLTGVLQKSSNVGVPKLTLAMPPSALVGTYSRFGLGKATNSGLAGERSGLYLQKQRWSDIEGVTLSFGYGLMVTLLQLARAYVTTDSYGVYRPPSIIKVDPPVPGECISPEDTVCTVVHMIEGVVLPGDGGVKVATKGYRIAIKTDTAKEVGPDGRYINRYIAYTVGVAPASQSRSALVVVINDPQTGKYYGGAASAPAFGAIMGDVLRTMNIEPDALTTGDKNELVNNQGKATGGRS